MADIVLPVPGESPNWGSKLNAAILRINQELEALGVQVSVAESGLTSVSLRVTSLDGRISALETGLEARIQQIAADVIASDPTVVQAAEDAVDAALLDTDISRRTDPAYPWMTTGDPLTFWRDRNGYGTFLEVRKEDGSPTPQSGTLIARTLIALGYNLSGGGNGGGSDPSGGPVAGPIICAGDSLTANDNWVSVLSSDVSIPTIDLGQAGQSSTEIAFRLGALEVGMTVSGNVIPASGSVDVTAVTPSSTWRTTSVQWYVDGWLAGVFGTFWFKSQSNPVARFVRKNSGSSVPCPSGTVFQVAPDTAHRSGVGFERMPLIYWSGRNNIDDTAGIQRDDTAVMNAFTGKKMILAVTNGTNETSNTNAYATIQAINNWKASQFPNEYWDVRDWLVNRAIYDMGLTPTSEDLSNMAQDAPPPQIMSDAIHFSPACSTALGHELAFQLRRRGL